MIASWRERTSESEKEILPKLKNSMCATHSTTLSSKPKEIEDSCYALSLPRLLSDAGFASIKAVLFCVSIYVEPNTACYCAFAKIEADAQDVSYRIVCNWHVNKMKSECTTVNRFCWCRACVCVCCRFKQTHAHRELSGTCTAKYKNWVRHIKNIICLHRFVICLLRHRLVFQMRNSIFSSCCCCCCCIFFALLLTHF